MVVVKLMKHHFHSSLHWASLAACTALTASALFVVTPVVRAQAPELSPSPTPHDPTSDIFDAIKKGADKLQKQAKDAGKIGPELKTMEERQSEFIKHQTEVERRLTEVLVHQEGEIHRLAEAVERLETEIRAAHAAMPHPPVPPAPPVLGEQPPPPPRGPAAPLPATEPPAKPDAQ